MERATVNFMRVVIGMLSVVDRGDQDLPHVMVVTIVDAVVMFSITPATYCI